MLKKGFTLIELLIVIAILGVLSVAVLVGINPVDKINAANDSTVQTAISQIANAVESNAVSNSGLYATATDWTTLQTALTTSGDLKQAIALPTGYTITASSTGAGPAKVGVNLKSIKYSATPFWVWCNTSGKAGPVAAVTTCP